MVFAADTAMLGSMGWDRGESVDRTPGSGEATKQDFSLCVLLESQACEPGLLLTKTKARQSPPSTHQKLTQEIGFGEWIRSCAPGTRAEEKLQAARARPAQRRAAQRSGVQVNNSLNFGTLVLTDVTIS